MHLFLGLNDTTLIVCLNKLTRTDFIIKRFDEISHK